MPDRSVQEMVEQYRRLTAEGDPQLKGERLLGRIVRTRDPAAVESLLTLYPTQAEWDGDEMNEVVSALRNAPAGLFAPAFARLAARVCRDTPDLFDALMGHTIGRCLPEFLAALPPLSDEDRDRLVGRVTASHAEVWKDEAEIPAEAARRQEALLAGLRR